MKFAYFGTPDISASVLEGLIDVGMTPDVLVCNPDRPVGRDKVLTAPATKKLIMDRGLETRILQPESKKDLVEHREELEGLEIGLVMAYGVIIPEEIINIFPKGIIGVHPSLLPELRGPSPIRTAILEGKERTGVTLYLIDKQMDHGPMIASESLSIGSDNFEELKSKIVDLSIKLCIQEIPKYLNGEIEPREQDHSKATYSTFFKTEDALIKEKDLENALIGDDRLTKEILRKIRALNPEPGAYAFMNGKRTKLLSARKEGIRLVLDQIQVEGKKPISLD